MFEVEIDGLGECRDRRRGTQQNLFKTPHFLIAQHLELTKSTWRLSFELYFVLFKSLHHSQSFDLKHAK